MKLKVLFTACITFLLLSSCKKEYVHTPPRYPIEGLWIGTYSVASMPEQGDLFYSFVIYPDGTLLTKGKGGDEQDHYSSGTWTLNSNNIFSATISTFYPGTGARITQSITATYSNTGQLTNGTWHDTDNPYGSPLSGTYSIMKRVN